MKSFLKMLGGSLLCIPAALVLLGFRSLTGELGGKPWVAFLDDLLFIWLVYIALYLVDIFREIDMFRRKHPDELHR